ncbi:MAG: flavin-containing monooxygenase [Actinomycetales bacterium]
MTATEAAASGTETAVTTVDALIVGAGFSGLQLLWTLRGLGFTVAACEQAPEVGGTWYWNRYPGARCDVESVDYSFGFDDDLQQEWVWTQRYPDQADILAYLTHVSERFDLRELIRFSTTVTGADFDETAGRWRVRTDGDEQFDAQFLIMAIGCLSTPKDVDLPGLDNFAGPMYRTSDWPHEPVDFSGQTVLAVGTGSSGAQLIPAIAPRVGQLIAVQRTPNFVIPAGNRPVPVEELDRIKAAYPARRKANRQSLAGVVRDDNPKNAFDVDDSERQHEFQTRWDIGGVGFLGAYQDLMVDQRANDAVCDFVRSKIDEIVDDPDVARRLKPAGYPLGAKRPVIATRFYETFNRDNVRLVDVRETPIETFTAHAVRLTTGEEIPLDAVALATGFDAFTGSFDRIDIRGVGGRRLADAWDHGPKTHLGLGVAGFPNMIPVANAGSPSVLSNMVTAIDQHVGWIADLLVHMRSHAHRTIEAQPQAQDEWVQAVEDIANMTLWPNGDSGSWYRGANIAGKTQIFMPYAGGITGYQDSLDECVRSGYAGFTFT